MTKTRRTRRIEVWMYSKDPARLRRRRRDKRLSQMQLAALAGVSQQYISLIETGDDRDVSEKVAERICRYLDVELDDLFDERRPARDVATVSRDTGDAA